MGKSKSGGSNPAAQFRRMQRIKENERNKKQRMEIRQTVLRFKDPQEVLEKLERVRLAAKREPDDQHIRKRVEQLEAAYKQCLELQAKEQAAEADKGVGPARLRGVASLMLKEQTAAGQAADGEAAGAGKASAGPAVKAGGAVDDAYRSFMKDLQALGVE